MDTWSINDLLSNLEIVYLKKTKWIYIGFLHFNSFFFQCILKDPVHCGLCIYKTTCTLWIVYLWNTLYIVNCVFIKQPVNCDLCIYETPCTLWIVYLWNTLNIVYCVFMKHTVHYELCIYETPCTLWIVYLWNTLQI